MKTNNSEKPLQRLMRPTAILRRTCNSAAMCMLLIALEAPFCQAMAGQKREPEFSDLPGFTRSTASDKAEPNVAAATAAPVIVAEQAPAPTAAPSPTPARGGAADEVGNGKTLYSFQATELELKTALATFARANELNIVPDNDISGTVTLDVRGLPLNLMMRALLEASDCHWHQEGGLIRVRNTETRIFYVDYLRLSRNGQGKSSATLSSATYGGTATAGTPGAAAAGNTGSSSVNLTADNAIDFWKEVTDEIGLMLTPTGKSSLAINKTASMIQVTDRPSALKRVEAYLKGVDQNVHRQVEIEAKLYDVTLNDQFQFGIDWIHVIEAYGGAMALGGATLPVAAGGAQLKDSAIGGLNRMLGGSNPFALVFTNFNTAAAINALKQQGNVEVISKPRIRTLNNQTALIKVGTETPFFSQTFQSQQSQSGNTTFSGDQITTITVGAILSITPQISQDDWISLDISPVLTSLINTEKSPSGTATAPILDTKQASTLVRVRDSTTVVMGGLVQTQHAKNETKIPVLGDIPLLGKLFTGTFRYNQKRELVIFVTPHIIRDESEPQVSSAWQAPRQF